MRDDVEMLARLHVESWEETYDGLLPPEEIASQTIDTRRALWQSQVATDTTRIAVEPGLGFAQMGPQRDGALAEAGWEEELYCLYLLRSGQGRGLGRELLESVCGMVPFTALVLETNIRACAFYERQGGVHLETRPEHIGGTPIGERVYGFGAHLLLM